MFFNIKHVKTKNQLKNLTQSANHSTIKQLKNLSKNHLIARGGYIYIKIIFLLKKKKKKNKKETLNT
jgi:hypothetical protein